MDTDPPERASEPPKDEMDCGAPNAPAPEPAVELPIDGAAVLPAEEESTPQGAELEPPPAHEAGAGEAEPAASPAGSAEASTNLEKLEHGSALPGAPMRAEVILGPPVLEPPSARQEIAAVVVELEPEAIPEGRAEVVDQIPADAARSNPPGALSRERQSSKSEWRDMPESRASAPAPALSEPSITRPRARVSSSASLPPVPEAPVWKRVWRQPTALAGLLFGLYGLVTYVSAAHAASDRRSVNAGLARVEQLGERVAREMLARPIEELKDLRETCAGKLPQRNVENAVLAYAAGPSPDLAGKLGARSRELPSHDVIGSHGGELDFVPVADTSQVDTFDLWTELLGTSPWQWDAAVAHRANRGPTTTEMQHLIVSIVRDASPPRLLSESTFDGGTSLQHIRIVSAEGASVCEGLLTTRIATPAAAATTTASSDDVLVVFGPSREAEAKYATHLRLAAIKSQCFVTGDSTFCHSIERAVNQ